MALTFSFKINKIEIDYTEINSLVAKDLINEIKKLISSGSNTSKAALKPKSDGSTPTFIDTGLLLNSLDYKASKDGFELFVSNSQRSMVMSYINQKNNWSIFESSEYLDKFAAIQFDKYIQQYLDKL